MVAVYFDGLELEEIGYNDPFTLGINIIWTLMIIWIIWDLVRGKNIKPTLLIVGAIMLGSLVWDYIEFGFGMSQIFYAIELLLFGVAFLLVKSKKSVEWYAEKSS